MSYFYADGTDRAGNRLLTSYGKEAQAAKYRAGATITEGERFLEISEDKSSAKMTVKDNGLLVRTLMVRAKANGKMEGSFSVYAKINGEWQKTPFRYKTYSMANSAVKSALINIYDACAVIEEKTSNEQDTTVLNDVL